MLVGDYYEPSKITFGGYDTDKYAKGPIEWHDLKSTDYWTLGINGAKLGDQKLKVYSKDIIIDSGTSYLLMPSKDFESIRQQFEKPGAVCGFEPSLHDLYVCMCTYDQYQ